MDTMVLCGHKWRLADIMQIFGAQLTVWSNGAFFPFLNVCPFFDDKAEKVHTLYFYT